MEPLLGAWGGRLSSDSPHQADHFQLVRALYFVTFALMFNLLGEMPEYFNQKFDGQNTIPGVHWHDYHKTPRAGRKIGHVTVTSESETGLRAHAARLAAELGVSAELNLEAVAQAVAKKEI